MITYHNIGGGFMIRLCSHAPESQNFDLVAARYALVSTDLARPLLETFDLIM